jgi:hypothetical protein
MVVVAVATAITRASVPDLARLREPLQAAEVQEATAADLAWLVRVMVGGVTPGSVCQMAWLLAVEAVEAVRELALAEPELSI